MLLSRADCSSAIAGTSYERLRKSCFGHHVPRKALLKGQLNVSVREPRGRLTAELSRGVALHRSSAATRQSNPEEPVA